MPMQPAKKASYPQVLVLLSSKPAWNVGQSIAYFVHENAVVQIADKEAMSLVKTSLSGAGFTGKKDQSHVVVLPSGKKLLFIGLGDKPESESAKIQQMRLAAARSAKLAQSISSNDLSLSADVPGYDSLVLIRSYAEAVILASYQFDVNKSERTPWALETVYLAGVSETQVTLRALQIGIVLGEQNIKARHLINTPAQDATPEYMASVARAIAESYGLGCTVLKTKELAQKGMGGIIAVCKGSVHEPHLVVLEYGKTHAKSGKTYALVGKGVCFDAGGLDIKTAQGMETMKFDKAGAIAVLCTIEAAARLKLPVHLYAVMPFVENMISGASYKPGDIIKAASGTTIEVLNTDAEGRIILADALHFAALLKPDGIIDIATLTGAATVALGNDVSAIMGNDASMGSRFVNAGEETYERLWTLPMFAEYGELILGDYADIKNVVTNGPGGPAGTIIGGKFLERFVGKTPWVHLDIAATGWCDKPTPLNSKGANGVGVRLLTQFLIAQTATK
jgi:leucyl aminopeptidase